MAQMSRSNEEKLCDACIKGDLSEVNRLLLNIPVDINYKNMGWTPVAYAAMNGHTDVAKLLVEAGADLNKDTWGQTPVSLAVMEGHTEVVKLLAEAGADLNIKTRNGRPPVYWAALVGRTEVVKLLVEAGADLNIRDFWGDSPYDIAIQGGHHSTAAYIKAQQETPERRLLTACSTSSYENAWKILEEPVNINYVDESGNSALHHTAQAGSKDILKLLIERNVDYKIRNKEGKTALALAHKNGHSDLAEILLDYMKKTIESNVSEQMQNAALGDENSNDCNIRGRIRLSTIIGNTKSSQMLQMLQMIKSNEAKLLVACIEEDLSEVNRLLNTSVDINVQYGSGTTPVSYAVRIGHTEVVKKLVKAGADLNIKNESGRTPVSYAAERGYTEIIKLLVEAGADLNIKDYIGRSPYDWAIQKGHHSTAAYIKAQQESQLAEQLQKASLDDKKTGN